MAIKVTVGEQETSNEVSFPKLMIGNKCWIVEVYKHPDTDGKYIVIHRGGPFKGLMCLGFDLTGFVDYNEPITLQNETT